MTRNTTPKDEPTQDDEVIQDKPAQSLLRSWGKRMSQGTAAIIPVYVGGNWTLQIPRGNKRVLQVPVKSKSR